MTYYKIVEIGRQGQIRTLFHGFKGSRTLPVGEWLMSETKQVRDGTSNTWYQSGWHVMQTLEEAKQYLQRFVKPRRLGIVACEVRDTWPKDHSHDRVYLCRKIKLGELCFEKIAGTV